MVSVRLPRILRSSIDVLTSYLFDIFLGATYNTNPPVVKYMTVSPPTSRSAYYDSRTSSQTHGGRFRFNPNLYAVSRPENLVTKVMY